MPVLPDCHQCIDMIKLKRLLGGVYSLYGSFQKFGVLYLGVLIMRIPLLRVLTYFRKPHIAGPKKRHHSYTQSQGCNFSKPVRAGQVASAGAAAASAASRLLSVLGRRSVLWSALRLGVGVSGAAQLR